MSKNNNRKKLSWKDILMIVMAVMILAISAVGVSGALYVKSMLMPSKRPVMQSPGTSEQETVVSTNAAGETIHTVVEEKTEQDVPVDYGKTGKVVNILLIGQDSRKGEEAKLSDTMILCTINKETRTLTMTSFLRDLYVQLPTPWHGMNCGMQRMNVAYALGYAYAGTQEAMDYLDLLILNNFGVEVDANVEVDFETFKRLVDILGGIRIELEPDEARYLNNSLNRPDYYKVDVCKLDGDAALAYARMRHANAGDNDFNRTNRQRKVINEIIEMAKGMTLSEMNYMVDEILPMVLTDMDASDMATYALELLPYVHGINVVSNRVPMDDTWYGQLIDIGGVPSSVIKFDLEKNRQMMLEIAECD